LPNGNTFICSGNQALLFEVTPKGEIVWRYKHPGGGDGGLGPGFGGSGGRPREGELVPVFLQHALAVTDSQRSLIQKLQEDVAEELARLLTDEQRQRLQRPMGFPPGGPGAPDRRRAESGSRGRGRPREPGRAGFRPRVGEVLPERLVDELELSEAQRIQVKEIQRRVDDRLAEIWTDEQKAQLKEMEELFARGPRFAPPPGSGPPAGIGPPDRDRPDDRRRSVGRPPRIRPGPGGPGQPPGPGGAGGPPGGGPGGIFCSFRYAADFPGLLDKELKPTKKLAEVAATTQRPDESRRGNVQ
jgi:hypothetical protein